MFALDTDTLTHLFRGQAAVVTRLSAVPVGVPVTITEITRIELLRGRFEAVTKAASGEEWVAAARRLADDEARLARLRVLPVTEAAAGHFDRLRGLKGFKKSRTDLLIACIALAHGATLVTRNTKDYATVPGLIHDPVDTVHFLGGRFSRVRTRSRMVW